MALYGGLDQTSVKVVLSMSWVDIIYLYMFCRSACYTTKNILQQMKLFVNLHNEEMMFLEIWWSVVQMIYVIYSSQEYYFFNSK